MDLIILYISNMLPTVFVGFIIYMLARIIYVKKTQKSVGIVREFWLCIFVVYMIALLSQTVIPSYQFGIDSMTGEFFFYVNMENANASVNLIPFNSLREFFVENNSVDGWGNVAVLNILANLLFFVPLGFLIPLLWEKLRPFKKVLLISFLITLFIEIIQYFIGRSSDIDDIMLNVAGSILGYGIYILVSKFLARKSNT
ncbi:MAG: VanZ family protein [Agathobacter sp.]|nr:VanZ family protein [Agathobacter sp.]